MAIAIDFLQELHDDPLPVDPATAHPVVLRSSCLLAPVQVTINNQILFEYGPRVAKFRGQSLPLLDAAVWGSKQLVTAGETGCGRYDIPFWWPAVYFGTTGRHASVLYTDGRSRCEVGYDELVHAWAEFETRVRRYLREAVPQLHTNPFWASWLEHGGTPTLPLRRPSTSSGRTSIRFDHGPIEPGGCRDFPFSWREAPVAALEYALEVPVELVLDGVEVLPGSIDGNSIVDRTALLRLAAQGMQALRWARRFGRGQCFLPSIPETPMVLWFELIGEDVFVWFNITGATAQVPYTELLAVWERFVREARDYACAEMPELLEQPYIGEWLAGKEYEEITALHPWEVGSP